LCNRRAPLVFASVPSVFPLAPSSSALVPLNIPVRPSLLSLGGAMGLRREGTMAGQYACLTWSKSSAESVFPQLLGHLLARSHAELPVDVGEVTFDGLPG